MSEQVSWFPGRLFWSLLLPCVVVWECRPCQLSLFYKYTRQDLMAVVCLFQSCRVLVLDQGMLVESGEPHDLLQNHQGIFSGMVTQTGPSSSSHLREVASLASFDRTASRTAVQMRPLQYLQPQLREQSEVLGRRYVDNPVQAGQQEGAEGGDPEVYRRTDSDLGRFGGQVRRIIV